ncbi:TadE/TadG family type IV pilus assembly protein [Falsiroseomonas tokyonensis]|uniref:TadE/TadG family type IV pilus assembly protein n=1 Tax=Falsiroseomonas tokyonensis TaxID=430521 RepID=A0ABV7BQ54_9PROT|nr:TadE family protein [Falsiroseomonas tokyonensis]MBU8537346.1 pilus assembly protein [Falsiroseomonas tokyonensis]
MLKAWKASRDRRGLAALEFCIAAPMLVTVLVGVMDLGRAIDQTIRLETAARDGAQYALSFPDDLAGIRNSVSTALNGQAGLRTPQVTMACECPSAGGGVPAADPGCTSPCSGRQRLLTIVAQQDFNATLLKNVKVLTGNVTLRIE